MTTLLQLEPYIEAVKFVLKTTAGMEIRVCDPIPKTNKHTFGAVTGLIGMVSPNKNGTLSLGFESGAILQIFSKMLGETLGEISDEVLDAVGEITNMVCGDVKRRLSERGEQVGMATPFVICGENVRTRDRVTRQMIVVPFETPGGKMVLETNFL